MCIFYISIYFLVFLPIVQDILTFFISRSKKEQTLPSKVSFQSLRNVFIGRQRGIKFLFPHAT